jgi:gliding motility-associated-like protein
MKTVTLVTRLRLLICAILLSAEFSAISQTAATAVSNPYAISENEWADYIKRTNILADKIDVQSFINYIVFSHDGDFKEMNQFLDYVSAQLNKDKQELIYRVGKGTVTTTTEISQYYASLQPAYTDYYLAFKKVRAQAPQPAMRGPGGGTLPTPFNCGSPCTNPGFESGTTFWDYYTGTACASSTSDPCTITPGYSPAQHVIQTIGGVDPVVGAAIPVVPPGGGNNTLMVGDGSGVGGLASRASISFNVSAANANFTYRYACVMQDPLMGHTDPERPYFNVHLLDAAGNAIACGEYMVMAKPPMVGFTETFPGSMIWYRGWTSVFVPLSAYVGQCVTVQFTTSDCSQGGHYGYAYIDGDCDPLALIAASPVICAGDSVLLTAPSGGAAYAWSNTAGGTTGIAGSTTGQTCTVNAAGTYQCIITSVSGPSCTTTLTVTVGTNPANPIASFTNTTVCEGTAMNFTDTSTPVGSVNAWAWDFNNDNALDDTTQNPSYTFPVAGTYPVTLTVGWGACTAAITQNVTVIPLPTADAGPAQTICEGSSVTLAGTTSGASATVSWSGGSGIYSPNNTVLNPVYTPSAGEVAAGSVTLTLTSINGGPCPVATSTVTITINPLATIDAGPDQIICIGSAATLAGLSGGSASGGTWSGGAGSYSPSASDANAVYTPTAAEEAGGVITLTYTSDDPAGPCSAVTDQMTILINQQPTANAGSSISVCEGSTITLGGLIGGSATSATWSGGAGTFSPNANTLNAVYTPTAAEYAAGSITLILTTNDPAGPCTFSSSSVIHYFYPKPVIAFTADDPDGCPVHCVQFADISTVAAGNSIISWLWDFGDGASGLLQNPSHCYSTTGFYDISLTGITNNGCSATLEISNYIQVFPEPTAGFIPTPNPASIINTVVTLNNTSSSDVTAWWYYFGDGDSTSPYISSPVHAYPTVASSSYLATLIVQNFYGCYDTISHPVEIGPEFTFFIPNAFTPNGDGNNDFFFGQGVGIEEYDLWIFDRWGNLIFHGDALNELWDGKANGGNDIAQQDVYVWKVSLTDVFQKKHNYMGTVTLVR